MGDAGAPNEIGEVQQDVMTNGQAGIE